MSGKSTFLRMLGANIVLAQTMNFVMAKEYEGCFLNIVSSIAPKDDINAGKSYYLAEAESILRIIKALEKDVTVFCNPIERISSSAEILSYINERNAIAIVATHDRELTDMLKDEYEFYYFSEDIDDNTGLSFDYKLKKGVSKTRNAIRLLEYIGYPNEIIQKSYKKSEKLEKDNTGLSFDYKLKKGVSKTRNAIRLLEYIGYPNEIIQKSYKKSEKLEKYI